MKLYDELASWWPLLSPPSEYTEEAVFYAAHLEASARRPIRSVLELGSGGGHNASHMKTRFRMTLVDRSPGMLAVSRALNPECEHLDGDMRTVRLGRRFDAVFIHDAVCYMTTEDDLRRALETASVHCAPGGAAVFAPDYVRERFVPVTDCGGYDGTDGRAARYLEWVWDPDPADTTYTVDYVWTLRDAGGSIRVEHDRHLEGLFTRADWLRLLDEAGFDPRIVPFEPTDGDPTSHEIFVATKPG